MSSQRGVSRIGALIVALLVIGAGLYASSYFIRAPSQPISYPYVVTDDLGRNITLSKQPQRIVSLLPSATQVVFAVGEGERIVGVTKFDDFPPELVEGVKVGRIAVVGGGFDPEIEKITSLKPDIILVNGLTHLNSKPIKRLQELGFTVLSLHPQSIDGVMKDIELVGKILGTMEKSQQLVKRMLDKVELITSKTKNTPKLKVYVENWHDPLFSVGPGSIQDEMVAKAGGINIFSDLRGVSAQVASEQVIARNPDVMIVFHGQVSLDDIKKRPGWDRTNAVKNDKVFRMEGQEGAANPMIVDSLEKMARLIHPEIFKDQQSIDLTPFSISSTLMIMVAGLRRKIEC